MRRRGASACSRTGRERGFQSFAFHPQFSQRGTPGYGKFYTYTDTTNMTPKPDFVTAGPNADARHGAARVDGEESGGRHLRRRRAARAVPCRATVRQSQRRPDRLQPAGGAGQPRVRPALYRPRRRRQRRRPVQRRAEPEPRRSARSCASTRSGKTAPTGSTAFRRAIRSSRTPSPTRSARSTPTACATRSGSRGTAKTGTHVRRRHRPEHRRGDQPGHRRRQSRLEQVGGELSLRARARSIRRASAASPA